MMEAARTSETLVNFSTRLHGATTQKTAIFVLTAVRTSNPTQLFEIWGFHGGEDNNDVALLRCVDPEVDANVLKTVCFSETLASSYESTQRQNPEQQHHNQNIYC
jgi:hypothetical protein